MESGILGNDKIKYKWKKKWILTPSEMPPLLKKILTNVLVPFPFFLLEFILFNIRQLYCTIGLSSFFQVMSWMNEEIKEVVPKENEMG